MRSPLALLVRVSLLPTDGLDAVVTCKLAVSATATRALTAVRAVAFWAAVLLPLAYLPLLLARVVGAVDPPAIAAVVALHAVALVVGHVYDGGLCEGFDRN